MPTIYYRFDPDRIIEVLNRDRADENDVLVGRDLDTSERARYDELKDDGHSDDSIYELMHSGQQMTLPDRVSVPIHLLSRAQLAWLIGERVGRRIRGLAEMEREDLLAIFAALISRPRRVG